MQLRTLAAISLSCAAALGACSSDSSSAPSSTNAATTTTLPRTTTTARADNESLPAWTGEAIGASDGQPEFAIESLGVTFQLPESFVRIDSPDVAFVGSSQSPGVLISIDDEEAETVRRAPKIGEEMFRHDIDGHEVLVVINARLDGLPESLVAAQIVVENGERSFSAIMTSTSEHVEALWAPFVSSLSID